MIAPRSSFDTAPALSRKSNCFGIMCCITKVMEQFFRVLSSSFFFSHFCTPAKEGAREERQKACDRRALWRSYQFRQTNREPSVMNGIRTNAGFTSIQRVGTAKYVIRLLHRSLLRAPVRAFPFSPSLLQNNRRKYTRSVQGSRDPPYCTRIKRLQMNNLRRSKIPVLRSKFTFTN